MFLAQDKKIFIKNNIGTLKTQVIVLFVAFLSVFVLYNSLKPAARGMCRVVLQSSDDSMSSFEKRIVGVEAQQVKKGTTLRQVKSIGILKAKSEVQIKSEIPGKIVDISFVEGGEVSKDQELIKFEDELLIAERDKAEASYILAKSEFDRMKKMYDQKVGALKDYDKALAQMNEAKANLAGTQFQLSRSIIKAPFSGVIGIMKVAVGNIVQQNTDLVTVVDTSSVNVEFMVPAKFIEDIAVGQSVEITVDSFKDRVFSGAVDAIDSEVDTKNHSVLVRAIIPNPNGVLKKGLFANVTLVTGEKSDVLLIDEDALDREGSIEFVWAIDDKKRSYRKRVLTGARDIGGVEILAGLEDGEWVVTAGHLKLSDGSKTKILNHPEETKLDKQIADQENKKEAEVGQKDNDKNKTKDSEKKKKDPLQDNDPKKSDIKKGGKIDIAPKKSGD